MKQYFSYILVAIAAFAVGKYVTPTKIEEKEKIVYQDRVVEKKVYVKDTDQKNNKVTIRLVTILPDGTKTIETRIYDQSEIEITQNGSSNIDSSHSSETSKDKLVERSEDNWLLAGAVNNSLSYGASVNRRILGPFHLGAFGFLDRTYGASLGISF